MRVFAGPNGSGKTTIFKGLLGNKHIHLGVYVNADDIEKELAASGTLSFQEYKLNLDEKVVWNFFKSSHFSPVKRNEPDLCDKLKVKNNQLHMETTVDSYLAADIAELVRQQLLSQGISFTYETVMSHEGKVDFLAKAKQSGYRVYLYYIATEDPEINASRVNVRVAQQGHAVPEDIIKNRYYKSLNNMKPAVKNSSRAYIFDNSEKQAKFVAEISDGSDVVLNDGVEVPNWVAEYLLK